MWWPLLWEQHYWIFPLQLRVRNFDWQWMKRMISYHHFQKDYQLDNPEYYNFSELDIDLDYTPCDPSQMLLDKFVVLLAKVAQIEKEYSLKHYNKSHKNYLSIWMRWIVKVFRCDNGIEEIRLRLHWKIVQRFQMKRHCVIYWFLNWSILTHYFYIFPILIFQRLAIPSLIHASLKLFIETRLPRYWRKWLVYITRSFVSHGC